jgi:hypothetical protein
MVGGMKTSDDRDSRSAARLKILFLASAVAALGGLPGAPATPAFAAPAETVAASAYDEVPLLLSAAEVLPPELREGACFRVWDRVENDGYLNHYVVDSDFGVFDATSTADLRGLVGEIVALAELEDVSRAEAFAGAVQNTVRAPVETARVIADEPVETLKRVPGGVGRYFKRTARRARNLVEDVHEEYQERKADKAEKAENEAAEAAAESAAAEGEHAPEPVAGGTDDSADPQGDEAEEDEEGEDDNSLADEARQEAGRFATRKLGYRRERRRLARELGVDPYSDNEVLNKELDRVAKAAAAGGLAVRFSGLGLPFFIYDMREVSNLVWLTKPLDLRLRNEKLLREELGLAREEIDPLYENRALSPTLITALVEALVALDGVGERKLFVDAAVAADSRDLAAFIVRIAVFHSRVHRSGRRVDRFEETAVVPLAWMADGSRVLAMAVDHLAWTEEVAGLFEAGAAARAANYWPSPVRRVVLEGTASARTERVLAERGWELVERGFELEAGPAVGAPPS